MPPALPPIWQERVTCSIQAAAQYGIPASVLLAVAQREAGTPGRWVRNSNGTYDLGAMQLNSDYVASLARYGIKPGAVLAPGCYSYQLAAWRIRSHLQRDSGDYWTRVANYHSRTPRHNHAYRTVIAASAYRWDAWLKRYRGASAGSSTNVRSGPPLRSVTSGFGMRRHPITGGWRAHEGVDIAARYGTPVVASTDGVVEHAGAAGGYGLMIAVSRPDGLQTRYGHLARLAVAKGQAVRQGQLIGWVGATGQATGPHLHFEVRLQGAPLDPASFFSKPARAVAQLRGKTAG